MCPSIQARRCLQPYIEQQGPSFTKLANKALKLDLEFDVLQERPG